MYLVLIKFMLFTWVAGVENPQSLDLGCFSIHKNLTFLIYNPGLHPCVDKK